MAKKDKKRKPKNYKYTKKHLYKKDDLVEFTWLGSLKLGTIIELNTVQIGNDNVAVYTIKDMHSSTKHPHIGHNEDMKFGNVVRKMEN